MQVSEAIGNEATFFLVSMLCGMGLVLTYDFFRIIRRLIPHGNIWIGIEDVCYWIFGTVVVFLLLYQKNDGMLPYISACVNRFVQKSSRSHKRNTSEVQSESKS